MNHAANLIVVERFTQQGYLSDVQCAQFSASTSSTLRSLIVNGVVPEAVFADTLASVFEVALLSRNELPDSAVQGTERIADFLLEHEALPVSRIENTLLLAVSDPSDEFILQVLRAKLGCEVNVVVALRSDLLSALNCVYRNSADELSQVGFDGVDLPDDLNNDSGVVRDLHRLIQRAVSANASDIHFEPVDNNLRVRFRVHGMLRDIHHFTASQSAQVVARLKLMSKLDVTERRQAQNGRFKFPADGRVVDLRVSTLPLHDGESVVLRLLEFGLSERTLTGLGFSDAVSDGMEQAVGSQQGLVLITGPTGSGKSTTLYSLLNSLNKPELKLISIEDPVELNIPGVNQIQVDEEHGISFAQALKTVLRQDPDVIMVGEIRDSETAQLAAQAALTGHLVLCTLHTASAASAVTRLRNLGLPDYLLAATMKAVLAQRLLRSICRQCDSRAPNINCRACNGSGYSGRTTIAELLPTTAFIDGCLESELVLATKLLNGVTLAQDAHRLLQDELIDHHEVLRVLGQPASLQ